MSNKLMPRLEKLEFFSTNLTSIGNRITELRKNGDLPVREFQSQLKALMEEEQKLNDEFNQWISTEFEFPEGPHTLPMVLKTVLEKTIDAPRIITLG